MLLALIILVSLFFVTGRPDLEKYCYSLNYPVPSEEFFKRDAECKKENKECNQFDFCPALVCTKTQANCIIGADMDFAPPRMAPPTPMCHSALMRSCHPSEAIQEISILQDDISNIFRK